MQVFAGKMKYFFDNPLGLNTFIKKGTILVVITDYPENVWIHDHAGEYE